MKNDLIIEFPRLPGMNQPKPKQNRCAVILAGGEGSRLKSLTRAIAGDE